MESIFQQIERYQQWKKLQANLVSEALSNRLIVVLWDHNLVTVIDQWKKQFQSRITSGRWGFNNLIDSWGSPIWLMRIWSKIGNQITDNWFFVNRVLSWEFSDNEIEDLKINKHFIIAPIISRILTLEWLEAYNLSVWPRSIYFHGTKNWWILYDEIYWTWKVFIDIISENKFRMNKDWIWEQSFDMPKVSRWCFGMLKDDVIKFSDIVNEWDLVLSLPSNK